MDLPKYVISRDYDLIGATTGGQRPCQLSDCGSFCIGVRWPDKSLTWLCIRGLETINHDIWKIA